MDFLSFSLDYWEGPRQNRQYFCEELAKGHRIIFCSPPFNIVKLIREAGRGTLSASGNRQVRPGLITHVPSKLLFSNHRFPVLDRWMRETRLAALRRLARRNGFGRPILLLWHPALDDMVGRFDEALVVYYVYDQYSGYTGGNRHVPDPREVALLERADVVFVVSRELYRDKQRWARNIHHLPNAVDFNLFSESRNPKTAVPQDIAAIRPPRIGYVGSINEKLNVELLKSIATARPEWSIVLIGHQNYRRIEERERFERLIERPNVHWLGRRAHHTIPAYLKGLDVCLMCYVVNDWTFFGDPLKMHEYLATGKPTVATGLDAVKEFSDVVDIPADTQGWMDAIEAGLGEADERRAIRRIDTARRNSYAARIDVFTRVIREALQRADGDLAGS